MTNLVFLAGLPRTGSTALSAILSQNPDIYAGPNSPVCQLMGDAESSCVTAAPDGAAEQLVSANRVEFKREFLTAIPKLYYKDVTQPVVVDKCRSWIWPDNMRLIKEYVTATPKIIVLERSKEGIIDSFRRLMVRNGERPEQAELERWVDGFFRPDGTGSVEWAKANNHGEFLFHTFDELMTDGHGVLSSIYEFCGWAPFQHDLDHIVCQYPEDDSVHGPLFQGMHEVRPVLDYRRAA